MVKGWHDRSPTIKYQNLHNKELRTAVAVSLGRYKSIQLDQTPSFKLNETNLTPKILITANNLCKGFHFKSQFRMWLPVRCFSSEQLSYGYYYLHTPHGLPTHTAKPLHFTPLICMPQPGIRKL